MNQEELNKDWIGEHAALAFVGALLVAPTLQLPSETYQIPLINVKFTVSNVVPFVIAAIFFLASFLLVLAYFVGRVGQWALREVPKSSPVPEILTSLAFTVSWISGINKVPGDPWWIVPLEWGGAVVLAFLLFRVGRGLCRYPVRALSLHQGMPGADFIRNIAGKVRRIFREYAGNRQYREMLRQVRARDPKENLETSPPADERIDLVCLWATEFYTTSHNEQLVDSFVKLGWGKEGANGGSGDPIGWLNGSSGGHQGSAWMNLGVLVPHGSRRFFVPHYRTVELPAGVEYATAGLYSLTPSLVSVVVCFVFEDSWSNSFNNALRTEYRTYATPTEHGRRFHTPKHQKTERVNEIRGELSQLAATWFSKNLPGLFSSGVFRGDIPTCEFITTRLVEPFPTRAEQAHSVLGYPAVMGIGRNYGVWSYGDTPDLKLRLPTSRERDPEYHSILAMREPPSPEGSSDRPSDNDRSAKLDRLNLAIPNWLSVWAILPLLEEYTQHIRKIRDSTTLRPRKRQNSLRILENLGSHVSYSVDIVAVADELASDSAIPFHLLDVSGQFEPAEEGPLQEGSLAASLTYMIRDRANCLQRTDAALRDQLTQYGSLVGATENVRVQKKLNCLTWVLVFFGLATLGISVLALSQSPWGQGVLALLKEKLMT